MRKTFLAAAFGFTIALLLGVTNVTHPARHPVSSNIDLSTDFIYVMDPNVGGASSGTPNVTPKTVACTNTQALGYDTATKAFVCLSTGASSHRITYSSVYMGGAATTAGEILGGGEFLSDGLIVDVVLEQIRFNIQTPGAGGNTNMVIRASDAVFGVTCDFQVGPCDRAAEPVTVGSSGPGSCTFPSGAQIVYTVESIGDCATGMVIYGNADIDGYYE